MKYIIVLGDGMADEPLRELDGQTPLQYAKTPYMDRIAENAVIGLAKTIPDGMKPGSDTANLAVLGYNPKQYYTGRSPLEALSIGVAMQEDDIAIRCNLVTVSDDDLPYEQKTMIDHSSGEISTKDAQALLDAVREELEDDRYQYYVGTSYRHCTIWKNGQVVELTPPHDILGRTVGDYLPADENLRERMRRSYEILNEHPINVARAEKGLNKANSIWFWGAGTKPALDSFEEKFGKKGAMISAVDLLKGIAVGAGMVNIEVHGADGTLETNYEGKAEAAVKAVTEGGSDFVYIHVEAPDEMGHQGSIERKVKAIENLDARVIGPVFETMSRLGEEFRMLIMPDHPTPICTRTHSSDPVPYMLYDSTDKGNYKWKYNEKEAKESGHYLEEGYRLICELFK